MTIIELHYAEETYCAFPYVQLCTRVQQQQPCACRPHDSFKQLT
jgi:hypothetical protein